MKLASQRTIKKNNINNFTTINKINNVNRIIRTNVVKTKKQNILIAAIKIIFHIYVEILFYFLRFFRTTKKKNISNQIALVTGGAAGLGKEICIQLAKQGCNIVIADIDLNNGRLHAKNLINEYNIKVKAYKIDISNYDDVQRLKFQIEKDLGPVDILINNLDLMPLNQNSFTEFSKDEVEQVFRVNLLSHIWTLQAFISSMRKQRRGHIVAVCSLAGLSCELAKPLSYTATKFGVNGLMERLEIILDSENINYIKITTVYSDFIASNKNMENNTSMIKCPTLKPSYIAEQIIDGILKNKSKVIVPKYFEKLILLKRLLPEGIIKIIRKEIS